MREMSKRRSMVMTLCKSSVCCSIHPAREQIKNIGRGAQKPCLWPGISVLKFDRTAGGISGRLVAFKDIVLTPATSRDSRRRRKLGRHTPATKTTNKHRPSPPLRDFRAHPPQEKSSLVSSTSQYLS